MDQKETEIALSELEERLDRLRAAYDQYFMGFEKLEPGVLRKDVERRFATLRKEQIRNTALRFRFNVVSQKYNTYSMYWNRICRQIEEGTFKRHVQRAKRRFGDARRPAEADISIDVDLGDFDEMDVESVLAEADAAAERYERVDAGDTIPPAAASEPPPSMPARLAPATPGTSFAIRGRREVLDEDEPSPSPAGPLRAARPVALPAGAKPRIVRRVARPDEPTAAEGAPPPSAPTLARPHTPAAVPAGARPGIRPAARSNPGLPPPSDRRMPAAPPSERRPAAPVPAAPPSDRRAPVAAPSDRRIPAPAASDRRMPAPAPSDRRIPVGAPSERRVPVPAPSDRRMPAAAPQGYRPVAHPPAVRPPAPAPRVAPEAPDSVPPPRPSARPRPPLPSQLRPEKKEPSKG